MYYNDMYIFKHNKISLSIVEVPGTCFSSMIHCNDVDLCHCMSIHTKEVCILEGENR